MNPKAKKKRPEGTRITIGGKNKAAEKVNRRNKVKKRGISLKKMDRQDNRSSKINRRRSDRAVRKGNFEEVTRKVQVSPASLRVVSKGKPASSKVVTESNYVPENVTAGDYAGQKERTDNTKPTPKKDGNIGQRIQFGVEDARKNKQEIATVDGADYRAGRNVKTSKTVTTPATKDVTEKIPAVNRTETSKIPKFKPHVPRYKRKAARKATKKTGSYSQQSNGRVKRVSVTGERK